MRSFFQASRYGDRTTLGNMSMVVFDIRRRTAIASSPSVEAVTEEERRPLRMIELAQELQELRAEETAFREEKKAYQDENFETITRVVEAEREGEDVRRRDQEVQEAWTKWREDERELRQAGLGQAERADRGEPDRPGEHLRSGQPAQRRRVRGRADLEGGHGVRQHRARRRREKDRTMTVNAADGRAGERRRGHDRGPVDHHRHRVGV